MKKQISLVLILALASLGGLSANKQKNRASANNQRVIKDSQIKKEKANLHKHSPHQGANSKKKATN